MGRLLFKDGSLPPNERRGHSPTTLWAHADLHKVSMTYLGPLGCFLARGPV
jgi:hypothetical protein